CFEPFPCCRGLPRHRCPTTRGRRGNLRRRDRGRKRMTANRYLIVPLAGAVLAAAGSSWAASTPPAVGRSHLTGKGASHARMPLTHRPSGSMPMHGSGTTVATMLKMGMTAEHAEVTVGSSRHYGRVLYDKDHFVLYAFSADHGARSSCYGACSST